LCKTKILPGGATGVATGKARAQAEGGSVQLLQQLRHDNDEYHHHQQFIIIIVITD